MISLVMTTYNGERFVAEQLESLKNQTYKIDEIIIIDDCSTDGTVDIVRRYIDEFCLNWMLFVNDCNHGWKSNFHNAIAKSRGDIIFLCDQDDIWEPNKVEVMVGALQSNPKIELLQSDYQVFYQNKPTKTFLKIRYFLDNVAHKRARNSLKVKIRNFDKHVLRQQPGCVMAFRRSLLIKFGTVWDDTLGHDWLLTIFALCNHSYFTIDFVSIKWRRHSNNASTPIISSKNKRLEELHDTIKILNIVHSLDSSGLVTLNAKENAIVKRLISLTSKRMALISTGKLSNFFYCLRHAGYYSRKREIISDLKYIDVK